MSCSTLNQQAINLNVTVASLPEGFCPATLQEFANVIAERMIISPSSNFNSFATGSTEPASNVGPWLKNCLEWYVYDDATGRYIPISKGGFSSQEYHETSGNFIVPESVFKIKITAIGAGGGGFSDGSATPRSGGGGGAFGCSIVTVTPGQAIAYVIGAGGAGGNPGAGGGSTTILGKTAGGGGGASSSAFGGGSGGVATGFDINLTGQFGSGSPGGTTSNPGAGGDAGGWGGKGGVVADGNVVAGRNGQTPGGGGSGGCQSANTSSGSGAGGALLIEF